MDRFPDGTHVWLQSRGRRGCYVHADEDGSGVSLSENRATLNAAWQVHRIMREGIAYVLLHCAAYGRYLALSADVGKDGHAGRLACQSDFNEPEQPNIRWRAVAAGDGTGDVLLCCNVVVTDPARERYLRANGKYRRWNNRVTVDSLGKGSTMLHWTVVQIPPRPARPAVPTPSVDLGVPTGLLKRRTQPVMERQRTIRYVQANDEENYLGAETYRFLGRYVFSLTKGLVAKLGVESTITLCVHAGFYGRLTPLVVDLLPHNEDPLDIIVLPTNSPAAMALRYPNVDAPDPAPGVWEQD